MVMQVMRKEKKNGRVWHMVIVAAFGGNRNGDAYKTDNFVADRRRVGWINDHLQESDHCDPLDGGGHVHPADRGCVECTDDSLVHGLRRFRLYNQVLRRGEGLWGFHFKADQETQVGHVDRVYFGFCFYFYGADADAGGDHASGHGAPSDFEGEIGLYLRRLGVSLRKLVADHELQRVCCGLDWR